MSRTIRNTCFFFKVFCPAPLKTQKVWCCFKVFCHAPLKNKKFGPSPVATGLGPGAPRNAPECPGLPRNAPEWQLPRTLPVARNCPGCFHFIATVSHFGYHLSPGVIVICRKPAPDVLLTPRNAPEHTGMPRNDPESQRKNRHANLLPGNG